METKLELFLDFDNTMVKSNKSIVEILNKRYFKSKNYKNCYKYNYTDLFPNVNSNEISSIYDSDEFFDILEITDGFIDMLNNIKNEYIISVVTIGTIKNLETKSKYIMTNDFKFIDKFYGINAKEMDKTSVDMSNGILIDDNSECLRKSNAKIKILFRNGKDTEWNKVYPNEEIYIVDTIEEIKEVLTFYKMIGEII